MGLLQRIILAAALGAPVAVLAGDVEIRMVELRQQAGQWRASVTLRHADTGWDHYADAWRLVSEDGVELGKRTLWHPHVNEQPFTRSLGNIEIPAGARVIYVEAHDKVHGWSSDRVRVELDKVSGERYRVERK